ncbi:MAG: hypothetical protein H6574_24940 [Lewinellaceae bacterium]|nr:hypothetical protein [Lewinellaceae bacterium]
MKEIESSSVESTLEVVSVALQAVPTVGGVLGGAISFALSKRKDKRIQEFVLGLAEDLRKATEQINQEFVRKEEFVNLTEEVIHRAGETWQKEKLDALKAIYFNTLISNEPKYDEATEVIWLVTNLQPRHLALLKILADPRKVDQDMGNVVGEGGSFTTSINVILRRLLPEWSEEHIDRTWKDLHDRGLHTTPGTKTMITDKGISQLENRLTAFGTIITEYLRSNY